MTAPLTFYFDINLGRRIPEALISLKCPYSIKYHIGLLDANGQPVFPDKTPDDVWLEYVGQRDWIVISRDGKFHRTAVEREAVRQHKVGCFYAWGNNAGTWNQFQSLIRAIDRIAEAAQITPRPFIYRVTREGTLRTVELPS